MRVSLNMAYDIPYVTKPNNVLFYTILKCLKSNYLYLLYWDLKKHLFNIFFHKKYKISINIAPMRYQNVNAYFRNEYSVVKIKWNRRSS